MKISPLSQVHFKRVVETFRRETSTVWNDGVNPKVENTTYDAFEYIKEDTENKKEENDDRGAN